MSRIETARSLERFGSRAEADIASFYNHNEQFGGGRTGSGTLAIVYPLREAASLLGERVLIGL